MGAIRPGGGGSSAPTADQVWDALGDALDADPTRATDLAAALGAAAVTTTTQTGSSSGWTSSNGDGTATTGSSYGLSYSTNAPGGVPPSTAHPRHLYPLAPVFTPLLGRWRVTARVTAAPNDSNYRLGLAVGKTDLSSGVVVLLDGSAGILELGHYAGSYTADVSGAGTIPTDGTGWVRLTFAGGRVSLEYGTGTTTAQPESWSLGGETLASAYAWESVILYLTRWGGSNDLGGSFDDVNMAGFA